MNEFLRSFIMTAIKDMIARNVALYQTYQYASGWFSKGILLQEDLEEIERLYEEKAIAEEKAKEENVNEVVTEEIVEEIENEEVIEETPVEEVETPIVEETEESEA